MREPMPTQTETYRKLHGVIHREAVGAPRWPNPAFVSSMCGKAVYTHSTASGDEPVTCKHCLRKIAQPKGRRDGD